MLLITTKQNDACTGQKPEKNKKKGRQLLGEASETNGGSFFSFRCSLNVLISYLYQTKFTIN